MDDLIKISINDGGKRMVSARELHKFMGVNTGFVDWMRRMITFGGPDGFKEGVDYEMILPVKNDQQVHGGHNRVDYLITLEMAKKLHKFMGV